VQFLAQARCGRAFFVGNEPQEKALVQSFESTDKSSSGTMNSENPQRKQTATSGKTQTIGLFSPLRPGK
jgi:hypothetical protein